LIRFQDGLTEVQDTFVIQKNYSAIAISVFKAGRGSHSPSPCVATAEPALSQVNCFCCKATSYWKYNLPQA